jgi:hypothetical protein
MATIHTVDEIERAVVAAILATPPQFLQRLQSIRTAAPTDADAQAYDALKALTRRVHYELAALPSTNGVNGKKVPTTRDRIWRNSRGAFGAVSALTAVAGAGCAYMAPTGPAITLAVGGALVSGWYTRGLVDRHERKRYGLLVKRPVLQVVERVPLRTRSLPTPPVPITPQEQSTVPAGPAVAARELCAAPPVVVSRRVHSGLRALLYGMGSVLNLWPSRIRMQIGQRPASFASMMRNAWNRVGSDIRWSTGLFDNKQVK